MYHMYLISNTALLVSVSLIPTGLFLINFFLPVSFVWFISFLVETNVTPFDFADGVWAAFCLKLEHTGGPSVYIGLCMIWSAVVTRGSWLLAVENWCLCLRCYSDLYLYLHKLKLSYKTAYSSKTLLELLSFKLYITNKPWFQELNTGLFDVRES